MTEFELIARYFSRPCPDAAVLLAGGDDCAALHVPAGEALLVSTDVLVADRHFPAATAAFDVGYKALAVNLSDLAAMGATPLGVTLGLALPAIEPEWLHDFAAGFYALAAKHQVCLVGGDTVKSPVLSLSITVLGSALPTKMLKRSGAQVGDLIAVTGTLGDAGFGLRAVLSPKTIPAALRPHEIEFLQDRLNRPTPRVAEGQKLAQFAHAALDVSDGLLQDLTHILRASNVGADLILNDVPLSPAAQTWITAEPPSALLPLSAGDDYELLFTLSANDWPRLDFPATVIGRITAESGLRVRDAHGQIVPMPAAGFDHFAAQDRS
jgi:thiamine-monophosphate kinase